MSNSLHEATASSLLWKLFERVGAQLIQFLVSIVLARILVPDDYGAIAIITIFIQLAQVFIQGGLSQALIQKKNSDDLDYSSVFFCSLFISFILYIIIYFILAPWISIYYNMPILSDVLRVLSITIIIGTYNSMQNTILSKNLLFKKLFWSSFSSIIIAGIIGVFLAYSGYGVWALVWQQIVSVIMTSIIMTFTVRWHPKLMFSFSRLKILFSFGWKLLFSGIIDVLYQNIYSLIIGKKYSSADLAYWNRGKQFPSLIVINIDGSISSVMYPVMSRVHEDREKLASMVRRSISISAYLMFPIMMGLAICAEPIVQVVLTDKWLECVPFLQGWCFCYAWYPIHTVNLQAYKAMGNSDIFLKLEIIKKITGISILLITVPLGLEAMMIGMICNSIISSVVNAFPNRRLLNYGYVDQLKDIFPAVLLSLFMGICVWCVTFTEFSTLVKLIIQVGLGTIIYVLGSFLFRVSAYTYIISIMKKYRR